MTAESERLARLIVQTDKRIAELEQHEAWLEAARLRSVRESLCDIRFNHIRDVWWRQHDRQIAA